MKPGPEAVGASAATVLAVLLAAATLGGCVAPGPHPMPDPLPEPVPETELEAGPARPASVPPTPRGEAPEQRPEEPLPRVEVEQLAEAEPVARLAGEPLGVPVPEGALETQSRAPQAQAQGRRVTLTAVGTELRPLLAALAEAAGVNLVVGPAVQGRVTVHFADVPAAEALEQVVRESGYMIVRPLEWPYLPTVFYVVPVNVNEADAATIQARFGVSSELAEYLVRVRIPPS